MSPNDTAEPTANTEDAETQDRTAGTNQDALVNLTQSALNSIIANEVRKVEAQMRGKYSDYDALQAKATELDQLKQAEETELEKLQRELAEKDAQIETAKQQAETERLNTLRLRVGQELGLPPQLSALLQGTDEEALKAHAQTLIDALPAAPGARVPNLDATAGGGQPSTRSMKLTPEQEAALANAQRIDPTMTREKYIEHWKKFQED